MNESIKNLSKTKKYGRKKKLAWRNTENILIDSDDIMYLTVDYSIEINNIYGSNIILSKVNVKLFGYDKMYMDKDSIL